MKKMAMILSAATLLAFTACSDNSSKDEGGDQVKEPVMNAGPNTEGERATDAVSDSTKSDSDSAVRRNKDEMSTPH